MEIFRFHKPLVESEIDFDISTLTKQENINPQRNDVLWVKRDSDGTILSIIDINNKGEYVEILVKP